MKVNVWKLTLALALCVSAITGSMAASPTGTGAGFKGPVGLQFWSLRDQFKKDVPKTLDEVQTFGIVYAELATTYGIAPEKFKDDLTRRGITAVSAHYPFEKYRDELESIVKEAKVLGLKYCGCAWIPHKGDFDEKTCQEAIAVFNKAGEALAKEGIKFFYHTHGYEFQPHGSGTLFDLLMSETKASNVSYEMDIFWIAHAGQDPAKLLRKYPNRWELMHLKDMRKGTPTGLLTGSSPVTNDVTLGTGELDLRGILKAAKDVGVKWYFIEDESPVSEKQIPESLRYLEQVKLEGT